MLLVLIFSINISINLVLILVLMFLRKVKNNTPYIMESYNNPEKINSVARRKTTR